MDFQVLLAWNERHALHDGLMNENAGRLSSVVRHLKETGVWDRSRVIRGDDLPAFTASDVTLLGVHSAAHLAR